MGPLARWPRWCALTPVAISALLGCSLSKAGFPVHPHLEQGTTVDAVEHEESETERCSALRFGGLSVAAIAWSSETHVRENLVDSVVTGALAPAALAAASAGEAAAAQLEAAPTTMAAEARGKVANFAEVTSEVAAALAGAGELLRKTDEHTGVLFDAQIGASTAYRVACGVTIATRLVELRYPSVSCAIARIRGGRPTLWELRAQGDWRGNMAGRLHRRGEGSGNKSAFLIQGDNRVSVGIGPNVPVDFTAGFYVLRGERAVASIDRSAPGVTNRQARFAIGLAEEERGVLAAALAALFVVPLPVPDHKTTE